LLEAEEDEEAGRGFGLPQHFSWQSLLKGVGRCLVAADFAVPAVGLQDTSLLSRRAVVISAFVTMHVYSLQVTSAGLSLLSSDHESPEEEDARDGQDSEDSELEDSELEER